ncbi:MAG TPA: SGNH/GDSL hydrolase family protein [Actinomycetota bacterium]|nr:SGNH/GDSL hydrolase family protein [Actinomycetota bacterium]
MEPDPFIRGQAWPGTPKVPHPRAKPSDAFRLPVDTWAQAQIPVGVRLELVGDATEVRIAYETRGKDAGIRGDAGTTFQVWRGGEPVDEEKAEHPEGVARLRMGDSAPDVAAIVYIPEGMRPAIRDITATDGSIEPAPLQPRWLCYGDSVAEGWLATKPAYAWPAIAGREQGLDAFNLGYAGSARGEIVSAEHLSELDAAVISITHGTNCWNRIPHSAGMMREITDAFLKIVRQGHPETPILVASPIVRPDAESEPNRLGATLPDLREGMREAVAARIDAGDALLRFVDGLPVVAESQLADGIHPNDDGQHAIAAALGPIVKEMAGR